MSFKTNNDDDDDQDQATTTLSHAGTTMFQFRHDYDGARQHAHGQCAGPTIRE